MSEIKESPWTKEEIYINLITIIISMILASYMMILKSWILILIYWFNWVVVFIVGRYLVCRHCNFLGEKCPSWCLGIIGSLLYKRSDKKDFTETKKCKFFLDVFLIAFAIIFPLIVYIFYFLIEGLILFEWILVIIYFLVGIGVFFIHSRSCTKCTVKGCPIGPKSNR
jgi:hypothetical protein